MPKNTKVCQEKSPQQVDTIADHAENADQAAEAEFRQVPDDTKLLWQEAGHPHQDAPHPVADRLHQDVHPPAAAHRLAAEAVRPREADTAAEAKPVEEEDKK